MAPAPARPGKDDVTKRLDHWAQTLEDAVARLNATLAEIKEIREGGDGRPDAAGR